MSIYGEFPECPNCFEQMDLIPGTGLWICPNCGTQMDDDDFDPWEDSEIPGCCIACGGPYPDCVSSCKIFDD